MTASRLCGLGGPLEPVCLGGWLRALAPRLFLWAPAVLESKAMAPVDNVVMSGYPWVKAFHIVFVSSWFAGLFYLPRLFVNLATVPPDSHAERERLLLMARRLHRFSGKLMGVAIVLGLVLWLVYRVPAGCWLYAKLALVAVAIGYHQACGRFLRDFEQMANRRPERWYRVFNEAAVLLFAAIVILVVVKPF